MHPSPGLVPITTARATRGRRARVLAAGILACLALVASACGSGAAPSASGMTPLRLSIGHEVLFDVAAFDAVAQAKGFYAAEGVEVTDRQYPSGSGDAVQLLVSDTVDVALGVGMFATFAGVQKAPIDIVSSEWQGYSDIIYYVAANSPVRSLADAAGLRVATSRPGSSTDALCKALQAQLTATGSPSNECAVIGSPPDIFTAVTTGQIEVGWTTPPFFHDELASGRIRQIGSGDDLDRYRGTTSRVNLANHAVIDSGMAGVQAFFRAYQRAIDFTYDNPDEAAKIWSDAAHVELTPELRDAVFEVYRKDRVALASIDGLGVNLDAATEFGILEEPLSEADVQQRIVLDRVLATG